MRIIYPPRPKGKITPSQLDTYDKTGRWLVQRKFNGTRNPIHVSPDGVVSMFGRHGEEHRQFEMSKSLADEILSLNLELGKEYWLDSELLAFKTKTPQYKGKVVLFDLLQAGRYLFKRPDQVIRLEMLADICGNPQEYEPGNLALQVTENVWLAENFLSDFRVEFDRHLQTDEIEGVVLRRKNSTIDNTGTKEYDITWQIRCRKPHKNYTW